MTDMQVDQPKIGEIDESLYSRQLYVLGHEAMKRMGKSDVLIVGLGGLGVEVAKNICLAGVRSVTIYDPEPATLQDLGTQFFLRESSIGQRRDEATRPMLAELNTYVPVNLLQTAEGLSEEVLSRFQVVVLTNSPIETQLKVNDFTHTNGIHFISTSTHGLFGSVFCDFGENFTVIDANGNEPAAGIIVSALNGPDGLITTSDESRHGLEDGDFVTFSEVQGMTELNDIEPRKITVKGPYTFTIGDTSKFSEYKSGGLYKQVKMPKSLSFKSLRESLSNPEYVISDFGKFDRPPTIHVGFQAVDLFQLKNGRLPNPRNENDAVQVVKHAKDIASVLKVDAELDEKVLKDISFQAKGDLIPITSTIGSFAAQEVLKACSGKFHPLVQYLYFDALECLPPPSTYNLTEDLCKPQGTRYDSQIAVFGSEFQERLANYREFLVGAGAIGCEMLKNWALMGLGTGLNGKITITDMDSIEKSNLNRQFLFRPRDLSKPKSEAAARAVTEMNTALDGHIETLQLAVGEETENVFGDAFFDSLDAVTNALDNINARLYMDRRCVYYEKPLIDSGTKGTLANSQVVIPHLTESYASSQDPPEKQHAMCTVKSFPNIIEHTIQWAREAFDGYFVKPAENVNLYLSTPNFLEAAKTAGFQIDQLKQIQDNLVNRPLGFDQCIEWARLKFEEEYNNEIRQLLHSLPRDLLTKEGVPFWSGPKRAPSPLEFDSSNPEHLSFVIAAANLRAYNYGLKGELDPNYFIRKLAEVEVPEFTPKSGIQVQLKDDEPTNSQSNGAATASDEMADIVANLPAPSSLAGFRLRPAEFEKDDDTNHHIDFITATSNLRASCYSIPNADRHSTKRIAGRIIPAIATTTAFITGLVNLELYKLIWKIDDIEAYKNSWANLALPVCQFSEPIKAQVFKYNDKSWTLWDRFKVQGDITLGEFVDLFKNEHKLSVTMVSCGVSMLYSGFMPKKREERMKMKLSALVESVSKKPIPAHANSLMFEIMADDETGEDVEVPFVVINFR